MNLLNNDIIKIQKIINKEYNQIFRNKFDLVSEIDFSYSINEKGELVRNVEIFIPEFDIYKEYDNDDLIKIVSDISKNLVEIRTNFLNEKLDEICKENIKNYFINTYGTIVLSFELEVDYHTLNHLCQKLSEVDIKLSGLEFKIQKIIICNTKEELYDFLSQFFKSNEYYDKIEIGNNVYYLGVIFQSKFII
jgi:hypothetical protein